MLQELISCLRGSDAAGAHWLLDGLGDSTGDISRQSPPGL